MSDAYILGADMIAFGRYPDKTPGQLAAEAALLALDDCGLSIRDVGVLYAGLMLTKDGPKLIEYNARFGDPECQVLMMRLKSDILTALLATCDGVLDTFDLRWRDEVALTVVMAANGYPGIPQRGSEIKGLAAAAAKFGAGESPVVHCEHGTCHDANVRRSSRCRRYEQGTGEGSGG